MTAQSIPILLLIASVSFASDLAVPLLLVVAAPLLGIAWTWTQELGRRWRFLRLIRRELEEVTPHPWPPDLSRAWWQHQQKHFVHREIFSKVTENRDFCRSRIAVLRQRIVSGEKGSVNGIPFALQSGFPRAGPSSGRTEGVGPVQIRLNKPNSACRCA